MTPGAGPYPAPVGRTARRLEWVHLPPPVRHLVERRCGSPVVEAVSQDSGFTPGFASVLTCEDGSTHFVKAASVRAQRLFADSYREEARRLRALPAGAPAPRLLWTHADDDWVLLGIEHVAARHPLRPWTLADLDACLDGLERTAAALTPVPEGLELDLLVEDLADWPALWESVPLASRRERRREAADLAGSFLDHGRGDTVVHTDVRDDNILLDDAGAAWFCDWNWPSRGPAWFDSLMVLIGPRGDGLDVEAVLAERHLLRDVPRDAVDSALAVLAGYFLHSADQPAPPSSPHLRDHQRWQGEVIWEWLAERRGW